MLVLCYSVWKRQIFTLLPCVSKNQTPEIFHSNLTITDFWQRGSLFNYLLIVGKTFDFGREPPAQVP